jgi:hypothetical protein
VSFWGQALEQLWARLQRSGIVILLLKLWQKPAPTRNMTSMTYGTHSTYQYIKKSAMNRPIEIDEMMKKRKKKEKEKRKRWRSTVTVRVASVSCELTRIQMIGGGGGGGGSRSRSSAIPSLRSFHSESVGRSNHHTDFESLRT